MRELFEFMNVVRLVEREVFSLVVVIPFDFHVFEYLNNYLVIGLLFSKKEKFLIEMVRFRNTI